MIHTNPGVRIAGTGSAVPAQIRPNHAITTSPDWVSERLGIAERRVVEKFEYSSDLATLAAWQAMNDAQITRDDVDLLVVATSTPDRRAPSTACLVQRKMSLSHGCPAYDVQAVCSGFLYGLTLASQALMTSDADTALVIGVDTFSRITDWHRRDCVFFGDGAGAVVLRSGDSDLSVTISANGSGVDAFTVPPDEPFFVMDGRRVKEMATLVLPTAIRLLLERAGLTPADIDHVIPHQPSREILVALAEELGIPLERVHMNMDRYANTAGATIPLLLDEVHKAGKLKTGDLVAFAAVGAGWTWGAGLYRWL